MSVPKLPKEMTRYPKILKQVTLDRISVSSGASFDIMIPSEYRNSIKRIHLYCTGLTHASSTAQYRVTYLTSTGEVTTGYNNATKYLGSTNVLATVASTSQINIQSSNVNGGLTTAFTLEAIRVRDNYWTENHQGLLTAGSAFMGTDFSNLSEELQGLRITTSASTFTTGDVDVVLMIEE